jgi:hypothetical protein
MADTEELKMLRSYDATDKYDEKEAKELKAPKWMIQALGVNPDYVCWGPGEDYMASEGADKGWSGGVSHETWKDFEPWKLDDLNECVNFYFYVHRDSKDCAACGQSGYNRATRKISDNFYAHEGDSDDRWVDKITQDEVDALLKEGRLMGFNTHTWDTDRKEYVRNESVPLPTAEQVNAQNRPGAKGFSRHDAINRMILIETRAKRLGVYGHCADCAGKGYIYTSAIPRLGLVLWFIHPRKGASRGVDVKNIRQEDLDTAKAYLRDAAKRNADRFGKLGGVD